MRINIRDLGILLLTVFLSSLGLWFLAGFSAANTNFDGPYYAVVAKCGYSATCIGKFFAFPLPHEYYAAHLPLFPILIRITSLITHLNLLTSGVLVTLLTTFIYAFCIYIIFSKLKLKHSLFLAILSLFMFPRMWVVRSISSPEPLFLVCIVLSLFMFERKKFFWAGIFGALATATKSPGILLFFGYLAYIGEKLIRKQRFDVRYLFIGFIPLAMFLVFSLYYLQTGDFLAYFHSGDNIHLQWLPFTIFDSNLPWVGTFWLEDVVWVYLISGLGVWFAMKKHPIWGYFGLIFFTTILFVSHRDIGRYSLPLVPVVLLGFSDLLSKKEVRLACLILIIPLFFYSLNFLRHNDLAIANLQPFLMFSK